MSLKLDFLIRMHEASFQKGRHFQIPDDGTLNSADPLMGSWVNLELGVSKDALILHNRNNATLA